MAWGQETEVTLEATCPCGATLKITARFPGRFYNTWLDRHRNHGAASQADEEPKPHE